MEIINNFYPLFSEFIKNPHVLISLEISSLLAFFVSYSWCCRPSIILASKSGNQKSLSMIKYATYASYIFFTMYLVLLIFSPYFSPKTPLLQDHSPYFYLIPLTLMITSLIIFSLTLINVGFSTLSYIPRLYFFNGIYLRCRNPQTLSIILLLAAIAVFRYNYEVLIFSTAGIILVLILAKIVCNIYLNNVIYIFSFYFIYFIYIILYYIILYIYFIYFTFQFLGRIRSPFQIWRRIRSLCLSCSLPFPKTLQKMELCQRITKSSLQNLSFFKK